MCTSFFFYHTSLQRYSLPPAFAGRILNVRGMIKAARPTGRKRAPRIPALSGRSLGHRMYGVFRRRAFRSIFFSPLSPMSAEKIFSPGPFIFFIIISFVIPFLEQNEIGLSIKKIYSADCKCYCIKRTKRHRRFVEAD